MQDGQPDNGGRDSRNPDNRPQPVSFPAGACAAVDLELINSLGGVCHNWDSLLQTYIL
jgi:hypothetical protein